MSKYWLSVYGKMAFQNKANKYLFAERTYRNIDRVIYIDETNGYSEYGGVGKFSEFDNSEWIPITKEEYKMIKRSYREIIVIREVIKLNQELKKLKLIRD